MPGLPGRRPSQVQEEAVLGMSHRGRLNVIVHILGKPEREIFARFEETDPESVMGSQEVIVVLNWFDELKARVPGR